MKKTIIILTALLVGFLAAGEAPSLKPFNRKIYVVGVGNARIIYRIPGEPISAPARVEIYIACGQSRKERLLKSFEICELEDYHYEPDDKSLVIKFSTGQVEQETGEVSCESGNPEKVGLDVCDQ